MSVKIAVKKSKIPADVRALLGRAPVLRSEDAAAYEDFFGSVAEVVCPKDTVEWILAKDYIDLAWEIRRLRVAKAGMIDVARKHALQSILESILERDNFEHAADRTLEAAAKADEWYIDDTVKQELLELMSRYGLDEEMITAQAIALRSRELAQIDLMLASAERRRNEMLREISLYREVLSARLGDSIQVLEGEVCETALVPSNNGSL
jgi:hypothetical protein